MSAAIVQTMGVLAVYRMKIYEILRPWGFLQSLIQPQPSVQARPVLLQEHLVRHSVFLQLHVVSSSWFQVLDPLSSVTAEGFHLPVSTHDPLVKGDFAQWKDCVSKHKPGSLHAACVALSCLMLVKAARFFAFPCKKITYILSSAVLGTFLGQGYSWSQIVIHQIVDFFQRDQGFLDEFLQKALDEFYF